MNFDNALKEWVRDLEDRREFALLYGRYPACGELKKLRETLALDSAAILARAAVRPGLGHMIGYWLWH